MWLDPLADAATSSGSDITNVVFRGGDRKESEGTRSAQFGVNGGPVSYHHFNQPTVKFGLGEGGGRGCPCRIIVIFFSYAGRKSFQESHVPDICCVL